MHPLLSVIQVRPQFSKSATALIAAIDSYPSPGDTWMLPVGGIVLRPPGKPARSHRSLRQRVVSNMCQFHIKGI